MTGRKKENSESKPPGSTPAQHADARPANSDVGYMGIDATSAGRLVLLSDVVSLWMTDRGVPCGMAVEQICRDIEAQRPPVALYTVRPGKFAALVTQDDVFDQGQYFVDLDNPAPPPPASRGVGGALALMRLAWNECHGPAQSNARGADLVRPLAIALNIAESVWGFKVLWSRADQPQAAEKAEPQTPSKPAIEEIRGASSGRPALAEKWTNKELAKRHLQLKNNHPAYTKELLKEVGWYSPDKREYDAAQMAILRLIEKGHEEIKEEKN